MVRAKLIAAASPISAQPPMRLGVANDMSGPYSDRGGMNNVN